MILAVGSTYTLKFKVVGDTSKNATGVVVAFSTTANLTITNVTGTGAWSDPNFTIGLLLAGTEEILDVTVQVDNITGPHEITGTVTTDSNDVDLTNNDITKGIVTELSTDAGILALSCADVNSCVGLHGNMLYVSTAGDDSTAEKGNQHRTWLTLDAARDAAVDGDVVRILNGTYNLTASNANVKLDQLAIDGAKVAYYLEDGVKLVANGVTVPFGAGKFDNSAIATTEFDISGNGELEYTVAGIDVAIPLYGEIYNSKLELKKLVLLGGWGIQTDATEADIFINTVIHNGEGLVYSASGGTDSIRSFKCNYIESENNTRHGIVRWQEDLYSNTIDNIEVGDIDIKSTGRGGVSLQSDNGGSNAIVNLKIGSINSARTSGTSLVAYTSTSTNAGAAEPELVFAGGGSTANVNFNCTVDIGIIDTVSFPVSFNGFIISQNSYVKLRVGYAKTNNYPAIGFFDFECLSNSRVEIEGHFVTTSNSHPCMIINQNQFGDGTGVYRFKNCKFEALGTGQAVVAIAQATAVDSDEFIFENCTFINDGVAAPIVTNSGTPINVRMINCYANSTVALSNITDILSGLTQNINVI